ncbi:MAG: YceI family protein [Acidobacteriaceae bacterium]
MTTTPRTLLLTLTAALLCTPLALAQHETFTLNPDASQVAFTLPSNHDTTTGTFHVQKGTVDFDRATPAMTGLIIVASNTGTSGNASRDKKMLNDVLQAAKFSDITFAPQNYSGTIHPTGDSDLQVTGVFTLHGAPHTLTVPMHLHLDGNTLTAKTTFKVPYVQWGLKDPSWFVLKVAKEVDITLTLTGTLTPPITATHPVS